MSNTSEKEKLAEVSYGTPTLNEWKQYFRNMKQAPLAQREPSPESSEESSFELDESFRALLDRKRQQLQEKALEENTQSDEEPTTTTIEGAPTGGQKMVSGNDSTFLEVSLNKVSDTSFEEMERICAVQDYVSQLNLKRAAVAEQEQQKQERTTPLSFGDDTQLDDVDEPTGLWDNTVLHATGQVLSPMKRVHLFRPSTIIEETTIMEVGGSKNSSIETYTSAKQGASLGAAESRSSTVSGSEVYRTAEEMDSYERSGTTIDSGLMHENTTNEYCTDSQYCEEQEDKSGYSKNSTAEVTAVTDEQKNVIVLDSSTSESDNEDHPLPRQVAPKNPLDSLFSAKDESSFMGNEQSSNMGDHYGEDDKDPNLSELEEMPDHFNDTMEETDFMLRKGMKLLAMKKKEEELQQSRCTEYELPREKSRTNSSGSEEGASYARHLPTHRPVDKDETKVSQISNFSYLTPSNAMKSKLNVSLGTGSGCKQTLFSSTGKNNYANKIPGPPSGGSVSGGAFKRPAISRLPQLKVGRKFDHIVSPIGAYIKKTPQSMLHTKITCPNKNLIDVLHSENRDSVMSNRDSKENLPGVAGAAAKRYTPSLPGKGVISSHRAHVLDERNPMRIPGGEKMQKLINNSPTMVIRHEGRIRYAGDSVGAGRKLMMNESSIADDSLKDISVASNDVSVRVLHDAKRF